MKAKGVVWKIKAKGIVWEIKQRVLCDVNK